MNIKDTIYQYADNMRKNPTFEERAIRDWFKNLELDYQQQVPVLCNNGKWYILDFVVNYNGVVYDIEIDGKQHKTKEGRASDTKREQELGKMGYVTKRIANNKVRNCKLGSLLFLAQHVLPKPEKKPSGPPKGKRLKPTKKNIMKSREALYHPRPL